MCWWGVLGNDRGHVTVAVRRRCCAAPVHDREIDRGSFRYANAAQLGICHANRYGPCFPSLRRLAAGCRVGLSDRVCSGRAPAAEVFQGNGIKIGEVSADAAVVWTRLTATPEANWNGAAFLEPELPPGEEAEDGNFDWRLQLPAGRSLRDMAGALEAAVGDVRVTLVSAGTTENRSTDWLPVDAQRDGTRQIPFTGLLPGTAYDVTVESRNAAGGAGAVEKGSFHTAMAPEARGPVSFVAVTCGDYPRRDDPTNGHRIYRSMLSLQPDFFVHTGDIEYFDKPDPWANSPQLARFKWNRIFALPLQQPSTARSPPTFSTTTTTFSTTTAGRGRPSAR